MAACGSTLAELDTSIANMWVESTGQIKAIDPASENWKSQSLPLARIKKIMKSEECIYQELERELQQQQGFAGGVSQNTRFMIAGEAPVLLGKACELLIKELSVRAWRHTERNRRRTLQRQDVHAAVGESEVYDFLIDIVPRVTSSNQVPSANKNPTTYTGPGHPQQVGVGSVMGAVVTSDGVSAPGQPQTTSAASQMDPTEVARLAHLQQMQDHMHEAYMMQMQQARMQAATQQEQQHQQLQHHQHQQQIQPPAAQVEQQSGMQPNQAGGINPTHYSIQAMSHDTTTTQAQWENQPTNTSSTITQVDSPNTAL